MDADFTARRQVCHASIAHDNLLAPCSSGASLGYDSIDSARITRIMGQGRVRAGRK